MAGAQQVLRQALMRYQEVLQAAEAADHGELEDTFFACLDNAAATLENELPEMADANAGSAAIAINAVLRTDGRIDQLARCGAELRGLLGPDLDTALALLQAAATPLRAVYASFDASRAAGLAQSDVRFVRGVVDRFFHEINLTSVAPVLMLDAARLGPSVPGEPAWRYGIGAGLRFSLVNSVRVTLGYSVNPQPRAGERSGALNLSLDFVDLFY